MGIVSKGTITYLLIEKSFTDRFGGPGDRPGLGGIGHCGTVESTVNGGSMAIESHSGLPTTMALNNWAIGPLHSPFGQLDRGDKIKAGRKQSAVGNFAKTKGGGSNPASFFFLVLLQSPLTQHLQLGFEMPSIAEVSLLSYAQFQATVLC
jgi:hypothetical protein